MAKKELLVPFINNRPCWWDGEVSDKLKVGEKQDKGEWGDGHRYGERKQNYEFEASLEIVGFSRGRSSVKLCLVDITEPKPADKWKRMFEYEVFLSDAIETITKAKNMVVTGKWTFTKRVANWGIKLVDE